MATRYTADDAPNGDRTNRPSQDEYEVGQLLIALDGQIARTQELIGRTARLLEEMNQHRQARPKRHLPPR